MDRTGDESEMRQKEKPVGSLLFGKMFHLRSTFVSFRQNKQNYFFVLYLLVLMLMLAWQWLTAAGAADGTLNDRRADQTKS